MILYWFENVIIGFFNVIKMSFARGGKPKIRTMLAKKPVNKAKKPFLIGFFLVHYGMFTFGHGIFVFTLFGRDIPDMESMIFAAFCLFCSHGVSFYTNFIKKGEYLRIAFQDLFFQPYKRIVVMHMTIIFGAGTALILNQPVVSLVILILLKILIDGISHKKEHVMFS